MKAYPLSWPPGWKRTALGNRKSAKFNKKTYQSYSGQPGGYYRSTEVSIAEGSKRVLEQLQAFGVQEGDAIISTNLRLRLDGLPRGDQSEPADPGVSVYWQRKKDTAHKVMAIDQYDRVADNLAAIAATLNAMRAIERHGSAMILERAFLGFQCLPAPNTWRAVLGFTEDAGPTLEQAKREYRMHSMGAHPDKINGSEAKQKELNWAIREAERELTP